jgi:hypothetical protein
MRSSTTGPKDMLWIDPKYDDDSDYWPIIFREEREAAINRFTSENPPLEKNIFERRRACSVPGRTISDVIRANHHKAFLRLAMDSDILNVDSNEEE